jgi:hypothetical protein
MSEPEPPILDDSPAAVSARHRKTWKMLGGAVLAAALLLVLYHFATRPPPLPGTGETLTERQVKNVMLPIVARLHTANIRGEAQFAGLAVTIAEGQMATTCHSLPAGGPLNAIFPDGTSRAESARLNRSLDVCLLQVRTTGRHAAILRPGEPSNDEKVYVVFLQDAKSPAQLLETKVVKLITDTNGTAFKLDTKKQLATGAAVFDTQGRVAGIVTDSPAYGGETVALSASRIAAARQRQRPGS